MRPGNGSGTRPAAQIFRIPALLAVLSLVGLVSALVGDGPLDLLSWITLAVPIAVIGLALARHRP